MAGGSYISPTSSSTIPPLAATVSAVCRICQLPEKNEPLISPCLCKGTLAYVHLTCLDRWLNQACRSYCELCQFHFKTIETRRYRMCHSLGIWIRHPRNWPSIRANLILTVLLTFFTLGLTLMFIMGLRHFIQEGIKVGIPPLWTTVVVSFFLALVGFVYLTTIFLFLKDQITPWYHWWSRCVNVQLLLEPHQMVPNINLLNKIDQPEQRGRRNKNRKSSSHEDVAQEDTMRRDEDVFQERRNDAVSTPSSVKLSVSGAVNLGSDQSDKFFTRPMDSGTCSTILFKLGSVDVLLDTSVS